MSTITTPGTQAGLKRFNIRIVTGGETAIQTALARTSAQAWNIAFDLAERLLGDKPPRSISVKPAQVRAGLMPWGSTANTRLARAHALATPARSAGAPLASPTLAMGAIAPSGRAAIRPTPFAGWHLPAQTSPAQHLPAA